MCDCLPWIFSAKVQVMRKFIRIALQGMCLFVISAVIILSLYVSRMWHKAKGYATESALRSITSTIKKMPRKEVESYLEKGDGWQHVTGERYARLCEALEKSGRLDSHPKDSTGRAILDDWRHPINIYMKIESDGKLSVITIAPGRDGEVGTRDDIAWPSGTGPPVFP